MSPQLARWIPRVIIIALVAAATAFVSSSRKFVPVDMRYMRSTPRMAADSELASSRSPAMISALPSNACAFAGERTSRRGRSPAAMSCRATSPPVVPVAPRTRIMNDLRNGEACD